MSSLRNAVSRRSHRERAQPLERRRLGLLEKHKDYSLRAKDFNKKQTQLKSLRQKAAERNDDEFYFGMMSRKGPGSRARDGKNWKGTVDGDRGSKVLSMEAVRLLKTQDMGYVRMMRQVVGKEIAKLEQQIVLTRELDHLEEEEEEEGGEEEEDIPSDDGGIGSEEDHEAPRQTKPKPARKIVFLDDEDQRQATLQSLDGGRREEDEADGRDQVTEETEDAEERATSLRRLKRQLENAKKKRKALSDAEEALDVQRAKMAKTATSGGHTRRGKKIMVRTRKR